MLESFLLFQYKDNISMKTITGMADDKLLVNQSDLDIDEEETDGQAYT